MSLSRRIEKELLDLEITGLARRLTSPVGIDLSSNDYLGLARDERLKDSFLDAIKREGVGSTASRLLRGERDCFKELEAKFARWKGTESSIYFASGYQANIGLLQTFPGKGDVVFSDEYNHASLIDGIRLSKAGKVIFRHLDLEGLKEALRATDCAGQKFLVTESLFSMDGDIAPLLEYADICRETGTNLIVDEAHAVGIYGDSGSGLIEEFGISEEVFLSVNTAGKALGVSGAFIAGSNLAIRYLINKCRAFIFSTAPIPSIAAPIKRSIEIIADDPGAGRSLLSMSSRFRRLLNDSDISVPDDNSHIIPIVIGDSSEAMRVAENLQRLGFDARAIRPPTVPAETSRLRISLNTKLTEEILRDFVRALRKELATKTSANGAIRR